ncbi:hypothetical protein PHMEG_00013164 [Phytophthora megakarya]|uniref:Uncharacterized protein n=1 Tax=Phytophthora megakarya TaxID=4795 RepID=A0A225W923_9STRA|nr:hypothetical protein PHMEG_00013164 [Phytophthora megakarya]
MWHTFGRAIDTCFACKSQLSIAASEELFLHIARIKTSVVQGVSIYKSAKHWEQCMLHALGMLFVGASEPSSYVFPLVPHAAVSDLPGEKPTVKTKQYKERATNQARERKTEYIQLYQRHNCHGLRAPSTRFCPAAPLPTKLPAGLSIHSLRRGSTVYAYVSPQLAIQWISTRGAWLLDSLTKAFAYVGTTTRVDQNIGKILASYRDPNLPCVTPTIATLKELLPSLEYAQLLTLRRQLFKNQNRMYCLGFKYTTLKVDVMVFDTALASLLIHLEDVANVVQLEQATTGFTSHYLYRFHEALDATDAALGYNLSLEACVGWDRRLRSAWETENFAQLGERCTGSSTVLAGAVTQMLSSIATMQRTLQKLVAMHETTPTSAASSAPCGYAECVTQQNNEVVVEAHSLAAPTEHDGVSYRLWKQIVWTLAENLDKKTNTALARIDGKGKSKTAESLRKRWGKLRVVHRPAYDAICSAFISRKANGVSLIAVHQRATNGSKKDLTVGINAQYIPIHTMP